MLAVILGSLYILTYDQFLNRAYLLLIWCLSYQWKCRLWCHLCRLPSFNNVSLLSPAGLSHLSLRAGTSRGSHFTFDFYFPSQLNWPPEMWNFVKWDAPGGSHDANPQPAFVASVCRVEQSKWKTEKKKKNERKWVNQSRRVHGDMCVCLSVCHCMCVSVSVFVCACLRRTACSGTGGLSGWIRQEPGAVLCTIRIKVAISGRYLLRDVLCSQFWWPLRPSPLNEAEMACAAAE